MNWRAIWAIVRKDLKVVVQNKGVSIPLIVVPLVFMVIMPALAGLVPVFEDDLAASMRDFEAFLENMPPAMLESVAGYDDAQTIVVLVVAYFLAPMYLILPLMVASVIAADSFAGEKERKTMEALLYTPTTDRELLLAKLLSAWVPAIMISLGGFVIYAIVANVAAWPVMGEIWFPNLTWIVLALWVAPAVAGLGLGITVIVSARVNTFQEAYQLGAIVVLPILLLVVGQATGVIYLQGAFVLLLGAFFWVIDAVLLWLSARSFRRSELATGM